MITQTDLDLIRRYSHSATSTTSVAAIIQTQQQADEMNARDPDGQPWRVGDTYFTLTVPPFKKGQP